MRVTAYRNRSRIAVIKTFQILFLAACLLPLTAMSMPIYTDSLQLTVKMPPLDQLENQDRADQIRKLIDYIQKTFRINRNKAVAIITEAVYNGLKHDLQPELILAIIAVESSYQEKAVSHAGARGLMQIMPKAHPEKIEAIGGVRALFNPKKNISTGTKILNEYLARTGNLNKALLRYNGSLNHPDSPYLKKVWGIYNKLKKVANLS